MSNSDKIRKAKGVRDRNLSFIENVNMFFTALLGVFGLIHFICGVKLANDDIISQGHSMGRL